jgi:hypothetical protein
MGKSFVAWLVIVVGLLLLPPISNFIDTSIMAGLSMWVIAVLVLVIGVKKLIMHYMKK